jgi:hypothetical protein
MLPDWQKKIDALDALSGVDPDASPNMSDFRIPDINAHAHITIFPEEPEPIPWRRIVGTLRQGRKYGIQYPASTPCEVRQALLQQLRAELPYAIIADEGEKVHRYCRGLSRKPYKTMREWGIGIVLGEPGYGIRDEDIDSRKEEWLKAARDFRLSADHLLQVLLRCCDLTLDDLPHLGAAAVAPGGAEHMHGIIGYELDSTWKIKLQMGAALLTHRETGQEVRVSLYHREFGGVLHGYGFSRWVKTTPEWSHLSPLLRDDYFDARRVIVRLYEAGCWEPVPRNTDIPLLGTKALTAKRLRGAAT